MPKVSVIMPSYNVSNYIEKSIRSVQEQTLEDIELLCVDKFSNDGTREIIEKLAKEDLRIRLLDDDKGSCGYANNKGIYEAKGEYIQIVETDDYIEPDMLETLYNLAIENDLDIAKGEYIRYLQTEFGEFGIHEKVLRDNMEGLYGKTICPSDYPELVFFDFCDWTGLYRRSFLVDNNVRFNETKGAAFQDHGFSWQACMMAQRAMYIEKPFYHYYKGNEAASMNNPNALSMDYTELQFIKSFLERYPKTKIVNWAMFYKKACEIVIYRTVGYAYGNGEKSKELAAIIYDYSRFIKEGVERYNAIDYLTNWTDKTDALTLVNMPENFILRQYEKAEAYKNVQEKMISLVNKSKSLVVFGVGLRGFELIWFLLRTNLFNKVEAFCDNNNEICGNKILGKTIFSVENAVKNYPEAIFICANQIYGLDMYRQLINMGIPDSSICIFNVGAPDC